MTNDGFQTFGGEMEYILNTTEARILGVLIEKEMSTPDYYPMTCNALLNACNQKTNRDPVMELDESAVSEGLRSLQDRRMVWQIRQHNSRALKYEHNLKDIFGFSERELAILCELLLRGPQTAGELRARTGRLTEFGALHSVEVCLEKLMKHEKGPFVIRLSRRPGQKENRYAHLFHEHYPDEESESSPPDNTGKEEKNSSGERIRILEEKVSLLEKELAEMKEQFLSFREKLD
jgi:uncharacterized protein YceH (UPF0502 family)